MWRSVPTLYFCEKSNITDQMLQRLIVKCLERCTNSDLVVTKFKLDIRYRFVNHWLGIASRLNEVKELDLCIRTVFPGRFFFLFPDTISLTSCTTIKLYGWKLNHLRFTNNLPSLNSMSLENVQLDDQVLHNLLTACCSLEKLVLKYCANLLKPRVSNSSLKFLEIVHSSYETTFEVEATSLQSLVYDGGPSYCRISLSSSCHRLQHLLLSNTSLHEQRLKDISPSLPLIESLSLCNCKIPRIEFWSDSLKHLVMREIKNYNVLQTTIRTPNLVSFNFEGELLTNFSMFAPNILRAEISLHNRTNYYDTQWYSDLIYFLRNVDYSESLSLQVCSKEAIIFPSRFRSLCSPLPTLKHLKLRIQSPHWRESELRDSLLWAAPSLETLNID
ncbi:LRR domain containing protein [Trema orientale]|uniref:LRR domain containing protein n=1 Tax=Trema orientale TaxID=63057 RepID=A0A2P5DNM9_TREOI|nr:LRR domain containing protein [Trema orientale]